MLPNMNRKSNHRLPIICSGHWYRLNTGKDRNGHQRGVSFRRNLGLYRLLLNQLMSDDIYLCGFADLNSAAVGLPVMYLRLWKKVLGALKLQEWTLRN